MPFVISRVNVPATYEREVELKTRLGRAIARVPGKNEQGLLLGFEDECHLWVAGDDAPMAYIEASVFANEGHAGYGALVAEIAQAFHEVLGIPVQRVYVCFSDIPVWSIGDAVVDRRMFG